MMGGYQEMTRHILFVLAALLAGAALLTLGCGVSIAQQAVAPEEGDLDEMARAGVGLGSSKCNEVQQKISAVVSIFESSLKDQEKMAQLSQVWAQSAEEMRKSGEGDELLKTTIEPYLLIMEGLAGQLQASMGAGNKQAPEQIKAAFDRMKLMTGSYVKMMRLLCPKLSLPAILDK
jgi:hypothetical protein